MSDEHTEEPYARPRDFIPPTVPPSAHDGNESPIGVEVVNWRTIGHGDVETVWLELDEWVTWMIHRYSFPPEKIGDCWWQHGAAVEELSALRTCWLASFDDSDSGYGPIGFHERLDAALPRLTRIFESCKRGSHHQRTARELPRSDETWRRWITRSHTHFDASGVEEKEE